MVQHAQLHPHKCEGQYIQRHTSHCTAHKLFDTEGLAMPPGNMGPPAQNKPTWAAIGVPTIAANHPTSLECGRAVRIPPQLHPRFPILDPSSNTCTDPLQPRVVLNEENKRRSVPIPRFPKNAHGHTLCWRLAVGGWRLATGG